VAQSLLCKLKTPNTNPSPTKKKKKKNKLRTNVWASAYQLTTLKKNLTNSVTGTVKDGHKLYQRHTGGK
jgi:hypothetical protein